MFLILIVLTWLHGMGGQEVPTAKPPLLVTPLNKAGSLQVVQADICLPKDHWILRGRLDVQSLIDLYVEDVSKIDIFLSNYVSEKDSDLTISRRMCRLNERIEGLCPKGSLVALETEPGYVRNFLYLILQQVEDGIADLQKTYFRFPKRLDSNLNILNQDTQGRLLPWLNGAVQSNTSNLLAQIHYDDARKIAFPRLSNNILQPVLNTVTEQTANNTLSVPSLANVTVLFYRLANVLQLLNFQVQQLLTIIQDLREGQLPIQLYNQIDLSLIVTHIRRIYSPQIVDSSDELIARLELQRLTRVIRSTDCEDQCLLDIYTIIPIITANEVFRLKEIRTMPSAKMSYLGHPKWTQVQPSKLFVLSSMTNTLKIESMDDLQCVSNQKETLDSCRICFINNLEQNSLDECERSLVTAQGDIQESCIIEEIKDPQDQVVRVKENVWAYLDSTPGTLTEDCPARPQYTFDLPYTGKLTFNPDCSYSMVNGPLGLLPMLAHGIKIAATQGVKRISNQRTLDSDLTKLETHFQKYGYIYLLTLAGVILIMGLCLSYFCCLRIRQIRAVRDRTRNRVVYTAASRGEEKLDDPATASIVMQYEGPQTNIRRLIRSPVVRLMPGGIRVNEIV
jgi:hypothetical protein